MTTFLVVANQTALSDELTEALLSKSRTDRSAEFILVVPATPVDHLLSHEEGQARQIASRRAGLALTKLTELGIPIVGAHVGGSSLFLAIDDAIRERAIKYDGIIVSTLSLDKSRWLGEGLIKRLETTFNLPVTHIVAELAQEAING